MSIVIGSTGTGGGPGSDTTAVHTDTPAEINGVTEKGTPIGADLLLIEDSADSNNKKKVQITNLPGGGGGGTTVESSDPIAPAVSWLLRVDGTDPTSAIVAPFPGGGYHPVAVCDVTTTTWEDVLAFYGGLHGGAGINVAMYAVPSQVSDTAVEIFYAVEPVDDSTLQGITLIRRGRDPRNYLVIKYGENATVTNVIDAMNTFANNAGISGTPVVIKGGITAGNTLVTESGRLFQYASFITTSSDGAVLGTNKFRVRVPGGIATVDILDLEVE